MNVKQKKIVAFGVQIVIINLVITGLLLFGLFSLQYSQFSYFYNFQYIILKFFFGFTTILINIFWAWRFYIDYSD